MSSDKLNLIKNFKLTEESLLDLQEKLQEIKTRPVETEVLPNGDTKIDQSYQMDKMIDIGLLSLEMSIATMKDSLAFNLSRDLEREIMNTQMEDKVHEAMETMKKHLGDWKQ